MNGEVPPMTVVLAVSAICAYLEGVQGVPGAGRLLPEEGRPFVSRIGQAVRVNLPALRPPQTTLLLLIHRQIKTLQFLKYLQRNDIGLECGNGLYFKRSPNFIDITTLFMVHTCPDNEKIASLILLRYC